METDEYEGTDKPKTIETVKIEWSWDFDDLWHEMKSIRAADQEYKLGKEGRFRLKGRCRTRTHGHSLSRLRDLARTRRR